MARNWSNIFEKRINLFHIKICAFLFKALRGSSWSRKYKTCFVSIKVLVILCNNFLKLMKTPQCATFTWNSCLSFCTLQALKIHNFKFQISIKFVSALFKLHTLSGEQWKSCLCLWMLLPLKIFYEKTNASIHLWLGPGSRPINIQNRTGSMCFIRFIVLPDNRTNDVVCTRVKKNCM